MSNMSGQPMYFSIPAINKPAAIIVNTNFTCFADGGRRAQRTMRINHIIFHMPIPCLDRHTVS